MRSQPSHEIGACAQPQLSGLGAWGVGAHFDLVVLTVVLKIQARSCCLWRVISVQVGVCNWLETCTYIFF